MFSTNKQYASYSKNSSGAKSITGFDSPASVSDSRECVGYDAVLDLLVSVSGANTVIPEVTSLNAELLNKICSIPNTTQEDYVRMRDDVLTSFNLISTFAVDTEEKLSYALTLFSKYPVPTCSTDEDGEPDIGGGGADPGEDLG